MTAPRFGDGGQAGPEEQGRDDAAASRTAATGNTDGTAGQDFRQRRWMRMVLTTVLLYTCSMVLLVYGAAVGIFPVQKALRVGIPLALTPLVFYWLIRSGLNRRFAEPSMAFPQALCAQTLLVLAYCSIGPAHPAVLVFLSMVMFFGMFDMGPSKIRAVMWYTVIMTSLAMAWCAYADPVVYPPKLELFYFGMMCTVLPAINGLSVQLAKMRDRLRTQKAELEKAFAHIQKVATHDELTSLPNRRHMLAMLSEHVARQARTGPAFAVALVDIDHFKKVNDTYGHHVGDEALIAFSVQARAQLRATDLIARWGGEEFLLLLPETHPPGDPALGIERLRGALHEARASEQVQQLRIAFSAGLTRHVAGENIGETIERADRALYRAKGEGRNRTVTVA